MASRPGIPRYDIPSAAVLASVQVFSTTTVSYQLPVTSKYFGAAAADHWANNQATHDAERNQMDFEGVVFMILRMLATALLSGIMHLCRGIASLISSPAPARHGPRPGFTLATGLYSVLIGRRGPNPPPRRPMRYARVPACLHVSTRSSPFIPLYQRAHDKPPQTATNSSKKCWISL